MSHPAEVQIQKALEVHAALLSMVQDKMQEFRDPRTGSGHRWCDLATVNQVNKILSEVAGFLVGSEGSEVLEEVAK